MESTENLQGWARAVRPPPPKVNMDLQPMQDGEGEGQGCSPYWALGLWPLSRTSSSRGQ